MIHVIYGAKGTGKTKVLVDDANNYAQTAKGVVVYIDRANHRMHDLNRNIRLVDASHYGLESQKDILSFIKGMLAANFDIEKIYIDGLARLFDCNIAELGEVYQGLEDICKEFNINVTITASGALETLPEFVTKYIG
ncbi:MAG: hypothetical protein IKC58_06665 [Clostridia bacterium]|nr:hypothetical protein [Clostridia bacterium]MBQ3042807.1 hypothetical protein [Clostridia bacterium]MBQ4272590.1 hypothetical protein [Clostridia bacterium]MBQ9125564.1 hypothetical protein [Clostridia bacterium]MBR1954693.1 hypothetical protein [Clostridia bacterium]